MLFIEISDVAENVFQVCRNAFVTHPCSNNAFSHHQSPLLSGHASLLIFINTGAKGRLDIGFANSAITKLSYLLKCFYDLYKAEDSEPTIIFSID